MSTEIMEEMDEKEKEPVAGQDTEAEVHLWQAVVAGAIRDWQSGPLRLRRQAEHYLFEDDEDFAAVCRSAGLDGGTLRSRLAKLRDRESKHLSPAA